MYAERYYKTDLDALVSAVRVAMALRAFLHGREVVARGVEARGHIWTAHGSTATLVVIHLHVRVCTCQTISGVLERQDGYKSVSRSLPHMRGHVEVYYGGLSCG